MLRFLINNIEGNSQYPSKKLIEFLNLYHAMCKNIKVIIYDLKYIYLQFLNKF